MEILLALALAGTAVGLGAKNGLINKKSDTSIQDTYAFERNAQEMALARVETKHRTVVELNGNSPAAMQMAEHLNVREEKIKAKIARIDEREKKWTD